jgi:dolichyl-phosphate beta-glucosyltransferase
MSFVKHFKYNGPVRRYARMSIGCRGRLSTRPNGGGNTREVADGIGRTVRAGPDAAGGGRTRRALEVIVPAFNEEKRLAPCLSALREQLVNVDGVAASIRVIDNGSTDRTAEVVDKANRMSWAVPVYLSGCAMRGKGSAVARGMVTSKADWVGFCDADLATPATTINDAVAYLRDGWDVVIGSRLVEGARRVRRQSALRRVEGLGFRLLTADLVRDVRDTQCGFKFFQGEAARRLFSKASLTGFAFDIEILALAADLGMSIKEIPVVWTDGDGSTLRPLHDAPDIIRELSLLRRRRRAIRLLCEDRPATERC